MTTLPQSIGDAVARVERGLLVQRTLHDEPPDRATLAERMEYYAVPGVSIAVIESEQIAWARAYGMCDATRPDAVTTETLFQAASISKPVSAVAALRLVEEGRLDLDEDVNTYLTSWKIPANGAWQPRITLRDLLCHGAGLTVHGFPGYNPRAAIPTLRQVLDGVRPANTAPIRVNIVPGTRLRYSGGGYCVLQQMLTDVTGRPFPDLMRALVLDPLGMERSTYEQPLPADRAHAAAGHHWGGGVLDGKAHVYPEMAAAGLWTTPSDIARFGIELLQSASGRSNKILSPELAQQMLASQVEDRIGLGIFLNGSGESATIGHGGANEGFRCDLVMLRERGCGAIVMTNSDSGDELSWEVIRTIFDVYGWPRLPFLPRELVLAEVSPQFYDAYAGKYEVKPGLYAHILRDGDQLLFQPPGQAPIALFPEADVTFFARVVNTRITFVKDEAGLVTGLLIQQDGQDLPAKKRT